MQPLFPPWTAHVSFVQAQAQFHRAKYPPYYLPCQFARPGMRTDRDVDVVVEVRASNYFQARVAGSARVAISQSAGSKEKIKRFFLARF